MQRYEEALRKALSSFSTTAQETAPTSPGAPPDLEADPLSSPLFWQRARIVEAQPRPTRTEQALQAMQSLPQQRAESKERGVLGTALHYAGEILDVGNRFVTRPVIGALIKAVSDNPKYQGLSYTQVFNEAFKDHPWLRFATEVVLDPMNLVGVGLVSKLAKVGRIAKLLETSATARKAFAAAELADETLGRIQALPVTVPLAGLKKGAQILEKATGKPLFSKTTRSVVAGEKRTLEEALRRAAREGSDWLRSEDGMRILSREEALNQLRDLPMEEVTRRIRDWDSVSLIQAWDAAKDSSDPFIKKQVRDALNQELRDRGLVQRIIAGNQVTYVPTERLARHLELEDALVSRELPYEARRALHDLLDAFATAIFVQGRGRYRTLEDVYGLFKIDTDTFAEQAAREGESLYQKTKQAAQKIVSRVAGNDSVSRILDAYEQKGVIDPELFRNVTLDDLAKRLGVDKEDFQTHYEVLRRGFEALDPYQRDRVVNWYRKWGTFMGSMFSNQELGRELAEQLVSDANRSTVTRVYTVTDAEKRVIDEMAQRVLGKKISATNPLTLDEWQRLKEAMRAEGFQGFPVSGVPKPDKVKGIYVSVDANPYVETARKFGLLRPENISDETLQRLGLTREQLAAAVDDEGNLTGDLAKLVTADILSRRSARDVALAAWAAGGHNKAPIDNFRIVIQWVLDTANGRTPRVMGSKDFAREPFVSTRTRDKTAFVQSWGNEAIGADTLFYDVLIRPPLGGVGATVQRRFSTFSRPVWERTIEGDLGEAGQHLFGDADKIYNYWTIVKAYSDLFDEVLFPIIEKGDDAALQQALDVAEKAFAQYVNDRHMKRAVLPKVGESFDDWLRRVRASNEDFTITRLGIKSELAEPFYRMYYYLAHRELAGTEPFDQWLRNESNTQALIWFFQQAQWEHAEKSAEKLANDVWSSFARYGVNDDVLRAYAETKVRPSEKNRDKKVNELAKKLKESLVSFVIDDKEVKGLPEEWITAAQRVKTDDYPRLYEEAKARFVDVFEKLLKGNPQPFAETIQKLFGGAVGFSTPREMIESGLFDDLLKALDQLPEPRRIQFLNLAADGVARAFHLLARDRERLARFATEGIPDSQTFVTLLQDRMQRIRGAFRLTEDGARITFSPFADVTTAVHELAHLLRYAQAGDEIFTDIPREEEFARAVERLLAEAKSGNRRLAEALSRYRRFAEVAYSRGMPQEQLDPQTAERLLRSMGLLDEDMIRLFEEAAPEGVTRRGQPSWTGDVIPGQPPQGARIDTDVIAGQPPRQVAQETVAEGTAGEAAEAATKASETQVPPSSRKAETEAASAAEAATPGQKLVASLKSPLSWRILIRKSGTAVALDGKPLYTTADGPLGSLPFATRKALLDAARNQIESGSWEPTLLRAPGLSRVLSDEEAAHLEWILLRNGVLSPERSRYASRLTDLDGKPLFAPAVAGEAAEGVGRAADEAGQAAEAAEEAPPTSREEVTAATSSTRPENTRRSTTRVHLDDEQYQTFLDRAARLGVFVPRFVLLGEVDADEFYRMREAVIEEIRKLNVERGGRNEYSMPVTSFERTPEGRKIWPNNYRKLRDLAEAVVYLRKNGGIWDRDQARIALGTWNAKASDGASVVFRTKSTREIEAIESLLKAYGFLDDANIVTRSRRTTKRLEQATEAGAESARGIAGEAAPGAAYRPLRNETIGEVLDQIAAEERLDAPFRDRVVEWLSGVFGDNREIPAILWMPGLREKTVAALKATTEQEAQEATADLLRTLGYQWEATAIRFPRAARILERVLPQRGRGRGSAFAAAGAAARSGTGLTQAERYVEILRKAANTPEVRALELEWRERLGQAMEAARRLAEQNPHLPPVSDEMTIADLLRYRDVADDPKPFDDLLETLGYQPGGKVEQRLRDQHFANLVERYAESRLRELGATRDPRFSRWLQRVGQSLPLRAWREQALLTPRYHVANALDAVVKGAFFGIRPIKPTSAFSLAEKLGLGAPPSSVLWRGAEVISDEFISPEVTPALETLVGRVHQGSGQALGKLVRMNRRLAQAMESSFRSAAWASETVRQLKAARPMLDGALRTELGPAQAEAVIKALDAAEHGVLFSPERLAETLRRHGATPDQVAVIQATWQRAIDEASRRGEELAQKLFFDYGDERNIEAWLGIRAWAPFHFWATRNIPFYLETLSQHPWLLRAWESYHDASRDWQENRGLTARFTDTLPLMRSGLFEFLFGPGTFYVNPMVVLSVADQLGYRYSPEDAPLLEQLQTEASRFGLGLAPWVEIPLGILGAFGDDWSPPRILRHSRLVQGITGVDVEYPIQQLGAANREAATGSAYLDSQIKRRILEKSLEETGRAAHPAYVAALSDPSSEIWKQAEADVRKRLLGQEVLGMTAPTRLPFLPDTEAVIRQQRALLPDNLPPGFMSTAAREGYPFAAYTPLSWQNTAGSRLEALLLAGRQQPLEVAMDMLRNDPDGQRYLLWLEQNGILWPWDPQALAAYQRALGTGTNS